jgi:hypothetical protein
VWLYGHSLDPKIGVNQNCIRALAHTGDGLMLEDDVSLLGSPGFFYSVFDGITITRERGDRESDREGHFANLSHDKEAGPKISRSRSGSLSGRFRQRFGLI